MRKRLNKKQLREYNQGLLDAFNDANQVFFDSSNPNFDVLQQELRITDEHGTPHDIWQMWQAELEMGTEKGYEKRVGVWTVEGLLRFIESKKQTA